MTMLNESIKKDTDEPQPSKGSVPSPFPWQLHECLDMAEKEGLEHIISWKPHGRAFHVHKPDEFVELIMPRYVIHNVAVKHSECLYTLETGLFTLALTSLFFTSDISSKPNLPHSSVS
mmetsp:Transcript_25600/g.58770  ORF Transcript_25600/g.58770 Transcript_25600/m.58770 type:complete len:118 (+) Transcript_25600:94-447(+)